MTKGEQSEFKKLIKEGTLEALESSEGKKAVAAAIASTEGQQAVVAAITSDDGKAAVVGALNSEGGRKAIKDGTIAAIKSEEVREVIEDIFIDMFHQVVVPVFEGQDKRIKKLEDKVFVRN